MIKGVVFTNKPRKAPLGGLVLRSEAEVRLGALTLKQRSQRTGGHSRAQGVGHEHLRPGQGAAKPAAVSGSSGVGFWLTPDRCAPWGKLLNLSVPPFSDVKNEISRYG